MTLTASEYLRYLKAYVNNDYLKTGNPTGGKVTLTEKLPPEQETRRRKRRKRKVSLLLPGPGFALNLDLDPYPDPSKNNKQIKRPLFHFLDDTGKPWSKRCDFVVFYVNRRSFYADCIEFKSNILIPSQIVAQLNAGMHWVKSLKQIIECYTGYKKKINLRKFIFAANTNPLCLNENRQLNDDPSIRYYHFDEVRGKPLASLQNTSKAL